MAQFIPKVYGENEYPARQILKRNLFKPAKIFRVGEIPPAEQELLRQRYGSMLQDVRPLTAKEWVFFSGEATVSPGFFLQSLYKVNGAIRPAVFQKVVDDLIAGQPILRTNFHAAGGDVWAVELLPRPFPVVFRALDNLSPEEIDSRLEAAMEADRHRGFDLETDTLLRIAVHRTSNTEYAVLVTQPQIVADNWDVRDLFVPLFPGQNPQKLPLPPRRQFSFAAYIAQREKQDRQPALQYWNRLLMDLPEKPVLPGYEPSELPYRQDVTRHALTVQEVAAIEARVGGRERSAWVALLDTAWGIMLQQLSNSDDTYYPMLLSNRTSRMNNVGETAAILNMLTVRLTTHPGELVKDLVKAQTMQLLGSQPMSYCPPSEIQALTDGRGEIFDHLLSFHGFLLDARRYSEIDQTPGVVPAVITSIDAHGMDLGVYFRFDGRAIIIEAYYNSAGFRDGAVEKLLNRYYFTLKTMLANWGHPVDHLKSLIARQFREKVPSSRPNADAVADFLERVDVFAGLSRERRRQFAARARIRTFYDNDTILALGSPQPSLLVLYRGRVIRYRAAADGWLNPLNVLREGRIINEFALLETPSAIAVEAAAPETVVLAWPLSQVRALLMEENDTGWRLATQLLRDLEKYQKRWIQGT